MSQVIRVRERESLRIGADGLQEAEVDYLARLRRRNAHFFDEARREKQWFCDFKGFVGAVALPSCRTLEILPKLGGALPQEERELTMRFLAVTGLFPSVTGEASRYAASPTILEAYLALVSELAWRALREGLPRDYVRQRFESGVVVGRLRLAEQLARYPGRFDRLLVEADRLVADTLINRAIKSGIACVHRLTRVRHTLALAHQILHELDDVGELRTNSRFPDTARLDRRHVRLRALLEVVELLLRGRGSAVYAGGEAHGPGLLFDIEKLWEAYAALRARRLFLDHRVTEKPRRPLVVDGRYDQIPDIVISQRDNARIVLDAKWKDFDGTAKVDDLRQAYVYVQIYCTDRVALLYPTWNAEPIRDDLWIADSTESVRVSIQTLPLAAAARERFDDAMFGLLS